MTDVTRVLDAGNHLGEAPIWSETDRALWWVNCEGPPELHRWSPEDGAHQHFAMPERVGGVVTSSSGRLLVGLAGGLHDFTPQNGALTPRVGASLPHGVKLHECQCDRQGRFWIGAFDHAYPADRSARGASFFRLDGDRLTTVIERIAVSNGLAFSPDGLTMYASDSGTRDVDAYDLDPASGALSNRRTFLTLEPGFGFIDGATVDSQGGYWLAVVGTGTLRRYRADGSLDRTVSLPFSNPTKPAFGGPGLRTLYVTSTRLRLNPDAPGFDANGGLFALEPGEVGVPEVPFAG